MYCCCDSEPRLDHATIIFVDRVLHDEFTRALSAGEPLEDARDGALVERFESRFDDGARAELRFINWPDGLSVTLVIDPGTGASVHVMEMDELPEEMPPVRLQGRTYRVSVWPR